MHSARARAVAPLSRRRAPCDDEGANLILIAYYLVFCLLCCAGLVVLMRHDRSHADSREHTE